MPKRTSRSRAPRRQILATTVARQIAEYADLEFEVTHVNCDHRTFRLRLMNGSTAKAAVFVFELTSGRKIVVGMRRLDKQRGQTPHGWYCPWGHLVGPKRHGDAIVWQFRYDITPTSHAAWQPDADRLREGRP